MSLDLFESLLNLGSNSNSNEELAWDDFFKRVDQKFKQSKTLRVEPEEGANDASSTLPYKKAPCYGYCSLNSSLELVKCQICSTTLKAVSLAHHQKIHHNFSPTRRSGSDSASDDDDCQGFLFSPPHHNSANTNNHQQTTTVRKSVFHPKKIDDSKWIQVLEAMGGGGLQRITTHTKTSDDKSGKTINEKQGVAQATARSETTMTYDVKKRNDLRLVLTKKKTKNNDDETSILSISISGKGILKRTSSIPVTITAKSATKTAKVEKKQQSLRRRKAKLLTDKKGSKGIQPSWMETLKEVDLVADIESEQSSILHHSASESGDETDEESRLYETFLNQSKAVAIQTAGWDPRQIAQKPSDLLRLKSKSANSTEIAGINEKAFNRTAFNSSFIDAVKMTEDANYRERRMNEQEKHNNAPYSGRFVYHKNVNLAGEAGVGVQSDKLMEKRLDRVQASPAEFEKRAQHQHVPLPNSSTASTSSVLDQRPTLAQRKSEFDQLDYVKRQIMEHQQRSDKNAETVYSFRQNAGLLQRRDSLTKAFGVGEECGDQQRPLFAQRIVTGKNMATAHPQTGKSVVQMPSSSRTNRIAIPARSTRFVPVEMSQSNTKNKIILTGTDIDGSISPHRQDQGPFYRQQMRNPMQPVKTPAVMGEQFVGNRKRNFPNPHRSGIGMRSSPMHQSPPTLFEKRFRCAAPRDTASDHLVDPNFGTTYCGTRAIRPPVVQHLLSQPCSSPHFCQQTIPCPPPDPHPMPILTNAAAVRLSCSQGMEPQLQFGAVPSPQAASSCHNIQPVGHYNHRAEPWARDVQEQRLLGLNPARCQTNSSLAAYGGAPSSSYYSLVGQGPHYYPESSANDFYLSPSFQQINFVNADCRPIFRRVPAVGQQYPSFARNPGHHVTQLHDRHFGHALRKRDTGRMEGGDLGADPQRFSIRQYEQQQQIVAREQQRHRPDEADYGEPFEGSGGRGLIGRMGPVGSTGTIEPPPILVPEGIVHPADERFSMLEGTEGAKTSQSEESDQSVQDLDLREIL